MAASEYVVCTFCRVFQGANVLLAAFEVDREVACLPHHRLVASIRGCGEAPVQRDVPLLLGLSVGNGRGCGHSDVLTALHTACNGTAGLL